MEREIGDKTIQAAWNFIVRRWAVVLLGLILLFGVLLRLLYLREIQGNPDFAHPAIDAGYHHYWARGIATGNWEVTEGRDDPQIYRHPFYRPPGYAYFLALIYATFGVGYLWPRIVQMALGLGGAWLSYYAGKKWFGRTVGLIWAFLMAVYWIFIFYEGELVGESLSVFLGLLLLLAIEGIAGKADWKTGLLAGLTLGVYALVRPNVLVFVPAAVGWVVWVCRRRKGAAWGGAVAGLLLGTVLALVPAMIRNYLVSGEPVPIATNAGISILVANNPDPNNDGTTHFIPGIGDIGTPYDYSRIVQRLERAAGRPLSHSEASNYLVKQALSFMRQHPGRFLYLLGRKALLFWGPREVRNLKETHYARLSSPVLRSIPLNFPLVLALAVLGALLFFTRKREGGGGKNDEIRMTLRLRPPLMGRASSGQAHDEKGSRKNAKGRVAAKAGHHSPLPTPYSPSREYEIAILLVLFIVFYFLSMLPFAAADRYRIPLIPFLLLFSACGLKRMGEFWIRGEWAAGLIWAAAGGLLFGLFSINATGYRPSPEKWHYDLALAYCDAGDWEGAIRESEAALRIRPEYPEAYSNLGVAYQKAGNMGKAIESYERALRLKPSARTEKNLGDALFQQGREAEALEHYHRALELEPAFGRIYCDLAGALAGRGRAEEAIDQLRQALQLQPENVFAHNALANILLDQNRSAEAASHYREALRINPRYAVARYNLANLLSRMGKNLEAIAEYEQVVRDKPDYVDAMNNLGAALSLAGRQEEAVRWFERALEVSPRDPAAHFNLGIVFAQRGQVDRARRCFEEVLRIQPDNEQARQALAALQ